MYLEHLKTLNKLSICGRCFVRFFAVLVILALFIYIPQTRAGNTIFVEKFSNKEICIPAGDKLIMDPFLTVRWMLSQVNVRDIALDINKDGNTMLDEKIAMLSVRGEIERCVEERRCNHVDEKNLLYLQDALQQVLNEGSVELPKGKYFRIIRLPVNGEYEALSQQVSERPTGFELFNREGQVTTIECINGELIEAVLSAQSDLDNNIDMDGTSVLQVSNNTNWLDKVLLRGSVVDLTKDKGRNASSATINVFRDILSKKTTYDVDAVLGISFNSEKDHNADTFWEHIWFLGLNRFKVTKGGSDVNEVSLGLITQAEFEGQNVDHIISIQPAYVTDSKTDVSLGTLEMAWHPIPGRAISNPFISPVSISFIPVLFKLGLEGRLQVGKVLDDGGNMELQDTQEYLRAGWYARTQFFGHEDTPIERLRWDTQYTHMTGFAGQFDNIEFFKSELSYGLDSKDTFSLNLSYEDGRKGAQLKKVNLWKVGFGVKF